MSFNQYQFDHEKAKVLPFLGDIHKYLYVDSKLKPCQGALYEIPKEAYDKIKVRLIGEYTGLLQAKDKVFVLPQCSIPLFKLKTFLRGLGASITSDITTATKIIGHNSISCIYDQHTNSSIIRQFSGYATADMSPWSIFNKGSHEENIDNHKIVRDRMNALSFKIETEIPAGLTANKTIMSYSFYQKSLFVHYSTNNGYMFTITPTGALIMHQILSKKIPVINENHVFKQIGKPLAIDDESFETICQMLSSEDESNHKLAAELIANCDFEKSYYYLWRLANCDNWRNDAYTLRYNFMRYRKYKNVDLFLNQSKFSKLKALAAEDLVVWLRNRNLLTEDIFLKVANEIYESFKQFPKSKIFDVVLETAEPYKEFATKYTIGVDPTVPLMDTDDDDDDEDNDEDDDPFIDDETVEEEVENDD